MQNYVQSGKTINVACDDPATPASGDPVRIGSFCGVAETDESAGGNTSGETSVATEGVFLLSVDATDSSGSMGADAAAAVEVGDKLYYGDSDSPVISKRDGGTFFGYALGALDAGDTGSIPVMLAHQLP
jgi:predicted RecA/RadA family phage recombinase